MSDLSPADDSLVSFDQQQASPLVTTPTKIKTNDFYENQLVQGINSVNDHIGGIVSENEYHTNNVVNKDEHHNGTNGNKHDELHSFSLNNELFPMETTENVKGESI